MAAKLKIEKRGDEILIVYCCLKMELMNHTINQTCPSRFWYISYKKVDMVLIGFDLQNVHPN
jgi:hypothetical protein